MIRVVVADDEQLVRSGIAALLHSESGIDVVAEAETGERAVSYAKEHRPDVVLMDIRMPGAGGVAATRAITADPDLASTRVVMLTTFDLDSHVYDALQAGASGFLLKDSDPELLIAAVEAVSRGETVLAPTLTRRLVSNFLKHPVSPLVPPWVASLTPRETQVLVEVARGLNNHEIAAVLHVSSATVKTHVARLLSKLGARDRTQLVVAAYEAGVVGRD